MEDGKYKNSLEKLISSKASDNLSKSGLLKSCDIDKFIKDNKISINDISSWINQEGKKIFSQKTLQKPDLLQVLLNPLELNFQNLVKRFPIFKNKTPDLKNTNPIYWVQTDIYDQIDRGDLFHTRKKYFEFPSCIPNDLKEYKFWQIVGNSYMDHFNIKGHTVYTDVDMNNHQGAIIGLYNDKLYKITRDHSPKLIIQSLKKNTILPRDREKMYDNEISI
jgi:hypothetical protein